MTYTAPDVFLATLRGLLFVREEPRNSNAGQAVEAMLKLCGLPKGNPWCAALISWAGRAAFGTRWPLPMTAGCVAMLAAAERLGMIVPIEQAQRGDIVLQYHASLGRVAHAFVLDDARGPLTWGTIEGNTNDGGSRDGWGLFARQRTLVTGDKVVRWAGPV